MNINRTSLLTIAICAIICGLSSWFTIQYVSSGAAKSFAESKLVHEVNNPPTNYTNESLALLASLSSHTQGNFILAAQKSTPAVVWIESATEESDNIFMLPNRGLSTGSGVIVSPDGYIVTNNHVVENADKIQVILNDNREYSATLIGTDPTTDVALIKIEDSGLPYLEFGNSDSTMVGEWVLAIGNPLRLQSTVTAGIVSAKARNIDILNNQQFRIESFIQTDAVVNPGNSGGALVNIKGDLIGINTAIMSQSGRYEGYSFSIPSNLVKKVIVDLKDYGAVQRGLLGVVIEKVNSDRAKIYGLNNVTGVFISNTTKDGAADLAGLKPEDIILEVNRTKIQSVPELQEIIGRLRPGANLQIKYWRDGKTLSTEATLKNQANTTALISTRRDPALLDIGIEARDLTLEEKTFTGKSGVKVLSIYQGSIVEKTNMAPNYIIISVNGKKVSNVDELIHQIKASDNEILFDGFYEKYNGHFPYRFHKK
jgi:Do/DeqQ family serine protease